MLNHFNKLFNHSNYFRYGFFLFLLAGIILNNCILDGDAYLFIFYIISVIFLGIGYYQKPTWMLIMLTTLVVLCRFFLVPDLQVNFIYFVIHLSTYSLITFISAGLMKSIYKVKEEHLELVTALANALDSRDTYTSDHSKNVAKYSLQIAEKMKLSKVECNHIHIGALLHDIGKIGIPEHILLKPGKLTNEEFNILKGHTKIGYEMIKHVKSFEKNGVLDIVLYHHERYDGKGYPTAIKGKQIPLFARIVAVADAFDAMTSKRVYRNELDLEFALAEVERNKGAQFDPQIAELFLSLYKNNETSNRFNKQIV
jgi:putative nucleotidyltransferase with HDIG domain